MLIDVLTRCYKRPEMLRANVASLQEQTDYEWRQIFIEDHVGLGVGMAQVKLAEHTRYLEADWVWVLDDDNYCTRDTLFAEVRQIAADEQPDVIMVRADRLKLGVLPPDYLWGQPPVGGRVDAACYIVRRDVWAKHADAWRGGHYASDYDFIHAVWADEPRVYWHDVIASRAMKISHGEPE